MIHLSATEHTFFLNFNGLYILKDHILGYLKKKNSRNLKEIIEIVEGVFSDHKKIKLEINNRNLQIVGN